MDSGDPGERTLPETTVSSPPLTDDVYTGLGVTLQESLPKPPNTSPPKRRLVLDTSRYPVTNPKDVGGSLDPNSKEYKRIKALGWIQGSSLLDSDDETPKATRKRAETAFITPKISLGNNKNELPADSDGGQASFQGTGSIGRAFRKKFATEDDGEDVNSQSTNSIGQPSRKNTFAEDHKEASSQGTGSIGRSSGQSKKGSNELEPIIEGIAAPSPPTLQSLFYQPVKGGTGSSSSSASRKRPTLTIETEGLDMLDCSRTNIGIEDNVDTGTGSSFSSTWIQDSTQSGDCSRHSVRTSTSSVQSDDSQTITYPFTDSNRAVQQLEAIYTRINLTDLEEENSTYNLGARNNPLVDAPINYLNANANVDEVLTNITRIVTEAQDTFSLLHNESQDHVGSFDSETSLSSTRTHPATMTPETSDQKKEDKKAARAERKAATAGTWESPTGQEVSVARGIKDSILKLDELIEAEIASMAIERYPKFVEQRLREQTDTEIVWYSLTDKFPRHPQHERTWTQKNLWCTTCLDYCPICCAPCCAFTGATQRLANPIHEESVEYDSVKEFLVRCVKWIGTGIDPTTFIHCSECRRWCCPECMGICPNKICADRTCVTCKPGRFEECDWHQF